MKLLLDLLPLLCFFGVFKWAGSDPAAAAAWATAHVGPLVRGGSVAPGIAPMLLATLAVISVSVLQMGWLALRRKPIGTMLWVSTALLVVLGGATVWLQSETFIKWKPTALYWGMAIGCIVMLTAFRRNPLQWIMGSTLDVPAAVWTRLAWLWVLFFTALGGLNVWVAYTLETALWVNFKLFGLTGLTLVFAIGVTLWASQYATDPEASSEAGKPLQ